MFIICKNMIDFSSLEKKKEVKRKNSFLYLQDMAFLQSKCVVSYSLEKFEE